MATGTTQTITNGLIFYVDAANVKSYPGSGTTWTDLSSTAITGSLTNGPTFNSANGGSVVFDGTNDHITFGNNLNFEITSPFTVSTWFRTTRTGEFVGVIAGKNKLQVSPADYTGYSIGMNVVSGSSTNAGKFGVVFVSSPFVGLSNVMRIQTSASYNDGNWTNGVITYNGSGNRSGMTIYINGTSPATESYDSNSISGTMITTASFQLGARDGTQQPFSGSIGQVSVFNRALSSDEVLQNYESTRERFNLRGIAIDPDASLFLRTAGITDTSQQSAIDTLVLELKNAGIWSKMKAIYPFVGGTAATHKWNLKDPRDLDAAFRLTFSGGWTHSSTGADPNGTNAYANTNLIPNNVISSNLSMHISYYSRQNSTGVEVEIGSGDYVAPNDEQRRSFIEANTSGTSYWTVNGNNPSDFFSTSDTDAAAFYIASRTSSTVMAAFRNNSKSGTATKAAGNLSQNSIYIGAYNRPQFGSQQASYFSTKQTAFATIGDGLTDAEATNLYTIVQKYQTTLGRQV
jgi:hypothetical protein